MKKALLLGVPVLLIGAAIPLTSQFMKSPGGKLEVGKTYEVWLQEAEVSPLSRNGEKWDADGSAPDLCAMMSWHDQIVLKTVVASDGLIASWGETAINASQALKGEADSSAAESGPVKGALRRGHCCSYTRRRHSLRGPATNPPVDGGCWG